MFYGHERIVPWKLMKRREKFFYKYVLSSAVAPGD